MLQKQSLIIRVQQTLQLVLQLQSRPHARLELFLVLASFILTVRVGLIVLLDVIDVRQASDGFPSTDGFKDGHVLVVGVVACAEAVENVSELLLALKVFIVFALEGFECVVVGHE